MNKNLIKYVRENAKAIIFLIMTIFGGTFFLSSGLTSYTSKRESTAFISCFKSCMGKIEDAKFVSENVDLEFDKDGAKVVVGRKSEAPNPQTNQDKQPDNIQVELDTKKGSFNVNLD